MAIDKEGGAEADRNQSGISCPSPLQVQQRCQEIGLVAFMFFFELLFFYVSFATSFYVSFTNLFSIILFLIC